METLDSPDISSPIYGTWQTARVLSIGRTGPYQTEIAEFAGKFGLVFIGAGAVAVGTAGLVGVALAHGLILTVIVAALGSVSGAHVNPAVTLAVWIRNEITAGKAVAYWVVQILGALAAALVLRFVLGGAGSGLGATTLGAVTQTQGVVIEAVLTFFLATAVLRTAVRKTLGEAGPLVIGLTLGAAILMGGPLTGASLNPARTLGPAIATGNFADLWVYLAGPALGAGLAALLDWSLER
jgi:MIP family channel proteins